MKRTLMTSSDPLELCDSRNTTSRFALNIMLSDFNLKCLEYKKGKRLDKKKKGKLNFHLHIFCKIY